MLRLWSTKWVWNPSEARFPRHTWLTAPRSVPARRRLETGLTSSGPRGKPGQSFGHQAGSAVVRGEDFSTTVAFDCTLHKEPPLDRLNYGPRRGRIKVMQIKEERCSEGGETVRQKILHWQDGEADKAASWRRWNVNRTMENKLRWRQNMMLRVTLRGWFQILPVWRVGFDAEPLFF